MWLYNTMTRKKEIFKPLRPDGIRMYVCGITAYDYCHVGHARSAVVFDVLYRYLRHLGYHVFFSRNFTDLDDKIINRANTERLSSGEVAEKYIAAFYEDMDRLGIQRPDIEPRATEHIPEMLRLAERLVGTGKAYVTLAGDIYFRVRAFPGYGKLSGRSLNELAAKARVVVSEQKEDPLDFAIWKAVKPNEPAWNSPWGYGRPGWHLECSAMNERYFPLPLDIHGGGQDLIFPHHENEIAQSEAASGKEFARFWIHNGFVQINSEKMSKSLGNFKTIRDIYAAYLPETLRFFLLTCHYRSPIDFNFQAMDECEKNLKRIYVTKHMTETALSWSKWSKIIPPGDYAAKLAACENGWNEAMADDLNSAVALSYIFGAVRLINRFLKDKASWQSEAGRDLLSRFLVDLDRWGNVLGVFINPASEFLAGMRICMLQRKGIDSTVVEVMIAERQAAKQINDFARADAIRKELSAWSVEVRDTPAGVVWDVV
ncbi:Cysteine--tRNA ligase [Desulfovibrionales bacterium]